MFLIPLLLLLLPHYFISLCKHTIVPNYLVPFVPFVPFVAPFAALYMNRPYISFVISWIPFHPIYIN